MYGRVSWVPGSPIDWAAITPTASPRCIIRASGEGYDHNILHTNPILDSQVNTDLYFNRSIGEFSIFSGNIFGIFIA
jgi:hypothetical protein